MKQKTVKTASKRIIVTGNGKVLRRKLSAQHLVAGKSKRTRSAASKRVEIATVDRKNIKKLIPYR